MCITLACGPILEPVLGIITSIIITMILLILVIQKYNIGKTLKEKYKNKSVIENIFLTVLILFIMFIVFVFISIIAGVIFFKFPKLTNAIYETLIL